MSHRIRAFASTCRTPLSHVLAGPFSPRYVLVVDGWLFGVGLALDGTRSIFAGGPTRTGTLPQLGGRFSADWSGAAADHQDDDARNLDQDVADVDEVSKALDEWSRQLSTDSAAGGSSAQRIRDSADQAARALTPGTDNPAVKAALVRSMNSHLDAAGNLVGSHAGTVSARQQALLALLARQQRGGATLGQLLGGSGQAGSGGGTGGGSGFSMPQISAPQLPKMDLGSLISGAMGGVGNAGGRGGGGPSGTPVGGPGGGSFMGDGSTQGGVVDAAMTKLGSWYLWGGKGGPEHNGRVDCSGLTGFAYRKFGIDIGPDTYTQINKGVQVPVNDLRKGDLIFSNFGANNKPGPGHVSMVMEDGNRATARVIQAPDTDQRVQITRVPQGNVVVKRILAAA